MSDDQTSFRMKRIERLLHELRYEIERGMMQREIDETINYTFFVPASIAIPKGVVRCVFQTRPMPHPLSMFDEPRLRVVVNSSQEPRP